MLKKIKKVFIAMLVAFLLLGTISLPVSAGDRRWSEVSFEDGRALLRGQWISVLTGNSSVTLNDWIANTTFVTSSNTVRSRTRGRLAVSSVRNSVDTWGRATARSSSGDTQTIWREPGTMANAQRSRTASGNRTFWNLAQ